MVAGVELDPLVVVDGCVVDWPDDDADVDDPELDEDAEPDAVLVEEAVLVELAVETGDEVPGCVPAPPCPVFPFVFVADEVLTALEELGRNSADDEATDSVELADEARELRMLEGTAVASDECEELSDAVVAEEEPLDAAEDDAPWELWELLDAPAATPLPAPEPSENPLTETTPTTRAAANPVSPAAAHAVPLCAAKKAAGPPPPTGGFCFSWSLRLCARAGSRAVRVTVSARALNACRNCSSTALNVFGSNSAMIPPHRLR